MTISFRNLLSSSSSSGSPSKEIEAPSRMFNVELNNNTAFNFKQWKSFRYECSIALENIRSGHIQHIFQMKEKRAEKAKVDLEEKKKKKSRATKAKRRMSDDEYYQCALVTLFHAKILRLCNLFIRYFFIYIQAADYSWFLEQAGIPDPEWDD